ncbi:MAG: hypothetical protein RR954_09120 [Christensenellaceae bacterium]
MLAFPNGNSYKLVYIDTNVINEIAKNTFFTGKNFLEQFALGGFAFATSAFNLYEISKTQGNSRSAILRFFDIFPLMICETYPRLIEIEKHANEFQKSMIMFAIGTPPLFNVQLNMILSWIDTDTKFKVAIEKMTSNFVNELNIWQQNQRQFNWMQNFDKNLLSSMNETFKAASNYFPITDIGKHKSLETYALIKNQFIYSTQQKLDTNSIIDAYNASFLPYADVYVTERTVGSWLETVGKKKLPYLKNKTVIKLSDLHNKK